MPTSEHVSVYGRVCVCVCVSAVADSFSQTVEGNVCLCSPYLWSKFRFEVACLETTWPGEIEERSSGSFQLTNSLIIIIFNYNLLYM